MQANIAHIEHVTDELWAGNLSSIIYFAGCDFNCPNCNSTDMIPSNEEFVMDLKDVKREIKEHIGTIKALVFSGGEPCLQRQSLITLATFAKDAGLKTALITNGSKTEVIRSLITLNLLDNITFDMKAPLEEDFFQKATKSSTFFKSTKSLMDDIKSTLKLVKRNHNQIQIVFTTTITPTLVSRKEDIIKIAELIEDIECIWELKKFNPKNVQNKKFSSIKPPSSEFLDNLKETIQKRFPNIRIFTR
jgi:pyruvate formate lyase activating enzyme